MNVYCLTLAITDQIFILRVTDNVPTSLYFLHICTLKTQNTKASQQLSHADTYLHVKIHIIYAATPGLFSLQLTQRQPEGG